ncbi:M48 family metallopeptidase [Candidatus Bathyarchaeota archaeon]|nr:M48 family metallopeptidase [Candidatus Bathyarchaeota archaeon]
MGRLSFYDEIARNKRSSILLAILVALILFALIYIVVYFLAPELIISLPLSLIFIFLYVYGSYMYGDSVVLASVNARPAEGREYQYLRDTVEGLSIAAGIPAPKVYIIDSDELNAFATGRDPEHASIAVTTGLVRELNRLELEGVIGHEISHIRNRDILFMTLVAVLVGLAAILSHIILRSFRYGGLSRRRGEREKAGGIEAIIMMVGLLLAVIAPIVTRLVQFAISRRREYLADASSAELTRYPEGLASALEKIMKKNRGRMDVSEAVSHLFFVDPNRSPLDSLYATHPPIEERIKRLRAM